ncbi:MAG: ATP-dependent RNA helicase HrpA [Gammaproteobacteria bacterium]|nr:ATP-dependent RNA helicase HrpA [Gammaproteobacteria bacterium]
MIGRQLARFPVDPRLGRMLIAAGQWGCLREMAIIVSGLSVQDPRERPMEKQQQADESHRAYQDERSDFLALLKLWAFFDEQHKHLSRHKLRQLCRQRYLSYTRLLEWRDVHSQLVTLCHELELRENLVEAKYYDLHQALLTGLLSNIGLRGEEREYLGARSNKFHIFPGSALFKTKAKWVMAAQLVETSKVYAHFIAAIEPEWIEQAAKHLTKSSHFEPHWEKERGEAAVYESVTLYGLPIVAKRKVNYGRIDPFDARNMFIRHALVLGDYETRAKFFHHNRGLMEEVAELEHKSRRPDILVDEQTLFQFYDERIPAEIHAARRFETWLREQQKSQPEFLFLTKEAVMRHAADHVTAAQFPETLDVDGAHLTLTYQHEPGHADDGVTLRVPQVLLKQLDAHQLEWLVPGLLREKVIELIRNLPKNLRRNFVPVPTFVDALLPTLVEAKGALHAAITKQLQRMTGVDIPRDAWDETSLPAHLRMNIHVIDGQGTVIANSRDLEQLRGQASSTSLPSRQEAVSPFERDGIGTWDFGALPDMIEVVQQQVRVKRYPALVDQGGEVALRLFDTPLEAQDQHRRGVRRLFMLQLAQQLKYLRKSLPDIKTLCTQLAAVIACDALREHIIEAGIDAAFVSESALPRTADEFNRMLETGKGTLGDAVNTLCALLQRIASEQHALQSALRAAKHPHVVDAVRDVQEQTGLLFAAGFITRTPRRWLEHYPRYLKAARVRLEKAAHGAVREAAQREQIAQLRRRYENRLQQAQRKQETSAELLEFRWLLEELRVSLFAQELKALVPVSVQRLEKKLEGC